jgi:large subunit ribosomal protein L29
MLKAKDLRDQSFEELEMRYSETKKELFELVNNMKHTKKLEKPHLISEKKRDIARLLTIMHQKKQANQG